MSKNKRRIVPDVTPALQYIQRLIDFGSLTDWEKRCLRQAARYLRMSEAGPLDLTPQQVADRFRVQPVTVRQWAAQGLIECVTTPGGHRRFPVAAVERFARERSDHPALED